MTVYTIRWNAISENVWEPLFKDVLGVDGDLDYAALKTTNSLS